MISIKKSDDLTIPHDADGVQPLVADPRKSERGFLQNLARLPGARYILPLALAANIGGCIEKTLASVPHVDVAGDSVVMNEVAANTNRAQSAYDTMGDLEDTRSTEKEVADYFATHLAAIKLSLKKHVTDEKILESLLKTVEMISKNQDGNSFSIAHNGALSPEVMAQFVGARNLDTIEVKPGFDINSLADRGHIVHEATHAGQKENQEKAVAKGKIPTRNLTNFWSYGETHPGQGMVVSEDETEGMAAEVEFINAALNGLVQKIIDDAPTFAAATHTLSTNKELARAIHNAQTRAHIIELSVNYFANVDGWESYIKHIYECRLQRQPFKQRSLERAQKLSREDCDVLKTKARIQ